MRRPVKIILFTLSLCLFVTLFTAAVFAEAQPWAVFKATEDGGTLTFCVGEKTTDGIVRETNPDPVSGDAYYSGFADVTTISQSSAVKWYSKRTQITDVVFLDEIAPKNTAYWFNTCNNLTSVSGIEKLNTGSVTSMHNMFGGCSALQELDLSSFNTGNVTDMKNMFTGCSALQKLNLSNFSNDVVTDMSYMFNNCRALQQLNLSGFNTGSVTSMHGMFNNCSALQQLDLSSFNTGSVTEMNGMFNGCSALQQLDLSVFNTDSVTTMSGMFGSCSALQQLNLSSFNTGSVTIMQNMFFNCSALSSLTLGEYFSFVGGTSAALPAVVQTSVYTGKWVKDGAPDSAKYTSTDLMTNYNGAMMAGTWVWERLSMDLANAEIAPIEPQIYTQNPIEPALTVTMNGRELEVDTDYTVSYDNNTDIGDAASATVTGIGVYEGTQTVYFTIYCAHGTLNEAVKENEVFPTCLTGGSYESVITCALCGEEMSRVPVTVDPLGHDPIEHEGKAPTCTENGWEAYETCSRCDYTTYNALTKLGHDIIEHEGKAPTCTEDGWEAYETCSRCDYTTYSALTKLGHDLISHEGKAPTCTENGWASYETCSRCDYTTYRTLSRLGHDFGEWVVVREASKDGPGLKVCTCSRCGETLEEEIPYRISIWQKLIAFIKKLLARFRAAC